MEERTVPMELKHEEDEDEFRSCCADEEEMELKNGVDDDFLDEFSVRMFFKGVSITNPGNINVSGIGVVIEGVNKIPIIQVQKKLEFFVDESVADYLAFMDGLLEATQNNIKRVFAFTDSAILFDQITTDKTLENPLLMALKQRILEHTENLEHFVLKYVTKIDNLDPLHLAQVAIGIINPPIKPEDESFQICSICREEKPTPMTITMKCSHKFCSSCINSHVHKQLQSSQVPIKCPSSNCRYYISAPEFKSFLPVSSYKLLEDALAEPNSVGGDKFFCPFSDCAVLLDPCCDLNRLDGNCVECPVCKRFICVKCGVPWHVSMSCDEFQDRPLPVADGGGGVVVDGRWRQCGMCERMIELTHDHMTCWCGHEFCYSCGAQYIDSEQTCECSILDSDEGGENDEFTLTQNFGSSPALEEWAWDSCGSLSNLMDAYSDQERSQLALIQRFLAGGFSLGDHHTYTYQPQSPPRQCTDSGSSYLDNTMKDLHQLPWLERFVSVISDDYYDEYTQ